MAQTEITPQARKILKKLQEGVQLQRDSGGWRLGRIAVSPHIVDDLARVDLIKPVGSGYGISLPGKRLAERLAAPDDAYVRQNRLLTQSMRKVDETPRRVTVNLADNPLAWLARRNLLSPAQLEAGDRLRSDFYLAYTTQRVTMNWSAPPLGRVRRGAPEGLDPALSQIAARRRLDAALTAAGPGLRDVLTRVVCAGEGLESAEKALAWPTRAAKLVLGFALDRLVAHYGIRG